MPSFRAVSPRSLAPWTFAAFVATAGCSSEPKCADLSCVAGDGGSSTVDGSADAGSVCDRAADVIYACTNDSGTRSGGSTVTCDGATEKAAQCIVDNPVAACGRDVDDETRRKYSACIDAISR